VETVNITCAFSLISETGCKYVDPHTVITPPGYKDAYEQYTEAGWQGLGYPVEFGGQGMPQSMTLFHSEIMVITISTADIGILVFILFQATANWTWGMYPVSNKSIKVYLY
jgi:alkylation response protein AidB-like acyl-CoA dehydrogenase